MSGCGGEGGLLLLLFSTSLLGSGDGLLDFLVPAVLTRHRPDIGEARYLPIVQLEEILLVRAKHLVKLALLDLERGEIL